MEMVARSQRSLTYDLPGCITYAVIAGALLAFAGPVDGRLARSRAAVAEFKRAHPCPSTTWTRGPCPGYQVDHIVPLKCNGFDTPANMQWLTVAAHAEKTRREARICRSHERMLYMR